MTYEPDLEAIHELVEQHYITERWHREADLAIYNYTPKTQYNRFWNDHTRHCRGLILDKLGHVVSRPFPKFFNLGEGGTEWLDEPFEVYEKLDGSLGVSFLGPDGWAIATRGSFQSEQARYATSLLRDKYAAALDRFDPMLTYLFEILYPENRIVVDYGGRRELVLLAVIDTLAGNELPLQHFADLGFPLVERYEGFDLQALQLAQLESNTNREGWVVRFQSGQRAKVKLSEYMRIHRLVTGTTPRRIWEVLQEGGQIMELVAGAPAAYQAWVRDQADRLLDQYDRLDRECRQAFAGMPQNVDRKTQAIYVAGFPAFPHRPVLFSMLDQRPYANAIWKALYPPAADPFKVEV